MKPRIVLPIVGIVSALVLFAAYVFRPFPTSITPENAAKIHVGQSYDEVESVLGWPRNEIQDEEIELAGRNDQTVRNGDLELAE